MIGYTEAEVVTKLDLELLKHATNLVALCPGKIGGKWVRCHELARAVGEVLGLEIVDGSYGAMEHSWLMVRSGIGERGVLVLDVYVPAALPQVQLRPYWLGAPVMYRAGEMRKDIRKHVVKQLLDAMRSEANAPPPSGVRTVKARGLELRILLNVLEGYARGRSAPPHVTKAQIAAATERCVKKGWLIGLGRGDYHITSSGKVVASGSKSSVKNASSGSR